MTEEGGDLNDFAEFLQILCPEFGDFLVANPPEWARLDGATFVKMWDNICKDYQWYQHKQ